MRLYRIFILLALLLAVVSCQHIEQGTQTETVSTPPAAAQDTELQETGTEIKVVSICDTTPTDAVFPDVEEPFWEDERYLYIFSNPISEYVTVEYSDGSMQNVKEALTDGHIVITDLDAYGISYFTEPMLIEDIIYHADRGGAEDALEPFFKDDTYIYSFPSIRSDVVIVYYKDGTEKPIKEALADGTVRISDLDWFSIKYYADKREMESPIGYGSEVTAFNNIREMIHQIESGTLSWTAQEIYDAHGCDTGALLELTGMDDGYSESLVEWCGGMNYSIYYQKDEQVIAFTPFYTREQFEQSLSGMDTWESLAENELILNLVKTDLDTEEGIMYECTYDTDKVKGLRNTYHDTTGEDGIRSIVTNWYGADGEHISGSVYVYDEEIPFQCLVSGFEADMGFAKRLVTKLVLKEFGYYEN